MDYLPTLEHLGFELMINYSLTHTIHGTIVRIYTDPWMVDFYGKLVGKYTVRPMDALGYLRVVRLDMGHPGIHPLARLDILEAPKGRMDEMPWCPKLRGVTWRSLENVPWMKMSYFPLNMGIFQAVISVMLVFRGVYIICFTFILSYVFPTNVMLSSMSSTDETWCKWLLISWILSDLPLLSRAGMQNMPKVSGVVHLSHMIHGTGIFTY